MSRRSRRRLRRGMTLMEVMIVIAILMMLMAVLNFGLVSAFTGTRVDTAELQVGKIGDRAQLFRVKKGRWPASFEELFVGEPPPVDPWGRPYALRARGEALEVVCFGADGREGGEGADADVVRALEAR